MRKKTYAANAILIGVLLGILVALKVNVILGVLAGAGTSILGWVLIRVFEDVSYKAMDTAADAIQKKIDEKKNKRQ